ncbi:hypothetical protein E9229_001111 [Paeniglutamicibacter cryotolerans]|uniref:Uncharacterized protein n=1 Tax=Paeniglutamicibacter cryotolerans TaxID=670079 RepID=A0A839QGA4_9MICC|nr:hypothetical protein [Paeniglutamicibacter cryotolerans]
MICMGEFGLLGVQADPEDHWASAETAPGGPTAPCRRGLRTSYQGPYGVRDMLVDNDLFHRQALRTRQDPTARDVLVGARYLRSLHPLTESIAVVLDHDDRTDPRRRMRESVTGWQRSMSDSPMFPSRARTGTGLKPGSPCCATSCSTQRRIRVIVSSRAGSVVVSPWVTIIRPIRTCVRWSVGQQSSSGQRGTRCTERMRGRDTMVSGDGGANHGGYEQQTCPVYLG